MTRDELIEAMARAMFPRPKLLTWTDEEKRLCERLMIAYARLMIAASEKKAGR